jgi:hypothetical protein
MAFVRGSPWQHLVVGWRSQPQEIGQLTEAPMSFASLSLLFSLRFWALGIRAGDPIWATVLESFVNRNSFFL